MFDVGISELLLCAVVALIVLGPERMPVAVRSLAKWLGAIRATLHAVKSEFEHELELDKLKQELQQSREQAQELARTSLQEPKGQRSATITPEAPIPSSPPPPRSENQLELSLDIQQAIDELKKASPGQQPLAERDPPPSPVDKS